MGLASGSATGGVPSAMRVMGVALHVPKTARMVTDIENPGRSAPGSGSAVRYVYAYVLAETRFDGLVKNRPERPPSYNDLVTPRHRRHRPRGSPCSSWCSARVVNHRNPLGDSPSVGYS